VNFEKKNNFLALLVYEAKLSFNASTKGKCFGFKSGTNFHLNIINLLKKRSKSQYTTPQHPKIFFKQVGQVDTNSVAVLPFI
jgi:hypothetical protein